MIATTGTYDGGVVIDKSITLVGQSAVIDASSSSTGNGIQIIGPGGSGSTVDGFKIENAEFEGILIGTAPVLTTSTTGQAPAGGTQVSDVRILDNVIVKNDAGFGTSAGQCFSTPNAPGDCGEAVHLVSVTDSLIQGNFVTDNAGGILLTDEFGPTSGNVIRDNQTIDNATDCGITLAGPTARPSIRRPGNRPAPRASSTTRSSTTYRLGTGPLDRARASCSVAAVRSPGSTTT